MGFPSQFSSEADLKVLNCFLEDKSYIEGFNPSQADRVVYEAISTQIDSKKYPHAARWYSHISHHKNSFSSLPGLKKSVTEYGSSCGMTSSMSAGHCGTSCATACPAAAIATSKKSEGEDVDLFGSSDEDDEEAEKAKAQRLAEYNAKKAKKPAVIAKSTVILDVKPWESDTNMDEIEKKVREISMDGLLWGASKMVPIGYGIRKLQINCIVEDDKVGLDNLEESITSLEDLVQSVDIVAFNKI